MNYCNILENNTHSHFRLQTSCGLWLMPYRIIVLYIFHQIIFDNLHKSNSIHKLDHLQMYNELKNIDNNGFKENKL